jgi:hypothetical protein
MRLISATVRNYRIHRDTRVDFDPSRTIIGGGNETGKSTFVEAIHRGLFLRSRAVGEIRSSMLPMHAAPAPEVEIIFDAGGSRYHLMKRFSGASGTTQLSDGAGSLWRGEEAESRLAALVGVNELQRASKERLQEQWAHLWVWQGQGMQDPSLRDSPEQDRLIRRLQEEGGAVVTQSDTDTGIFRALEQRYREFYTATGMPKAGSDLKAAMEARDRSEERRIAADTAYQRLLFAINEVEKAEAEILECSKLGATLRRDHAAVSAGLSKAAELAGAIIRKEADAKLAEAPWKALLEVRERVLELQRDISLHTESLAPLEAMHDDLKRRVSEAAAAYEAATARSGAAGSSTAAAVTSLECIRSWVALFEAEETHGRMAGLMQQAEGYSISSKALEHELSLLPAVDGEALSLLREALSELERADAGLEAMASGVTVLEGDGSVRIGGKTVSEGESVLLDDAAEIEAGGRFRFMIRPGGGNSLLLARIRAEEARSRFSSLLEGYGVGSMHAALEADSRRRDLSTDRMTADASLKVLDPDGMLRMRFEASGRQLEEARRAASSAAGRSGGIPRPETEADARALLESFESALGEARRKEREEHDAMVASGALFQRLQTELQLKTEESARQRQGLDACRSELERLRQRHGRDDALQEALARALGDKNEADGALAALQALYRDLQPRQLEKDLERLDRAERLNRQRIQECRERASGQRAVLERDGTDDPPGTLYAATEGARQAEAQYRAVLQRAMATKLLYELFCEEQAEDARRFSRPLAVKITRYLRCMFGPGLEAAIDYTGKTFSNIRIQRDGTGSIGFSGLSGGMQEQVSAAVRLSIAELLAEGYGGTLPVVFDDAFTNTDPMRVQLLQRMLDRAASNGLQIIILSCNPGEYASLGASSVILEGPARREEVVGGGI